MGKSSFRFGAAGRAAGGRLLLIWAGLAAIFVVNPDPEQPGGGAAARAAGGGGRECACARGRAPGAPRGGGAGAPGLRPLLFLFSSCHDRRGDAQPYQVPAGRARAGGAGGAGGAAGPAGREEPLLERRLREPLQALRGHGSAAPAACARPPRRSPSRCGRSS